MSDLDTRIAQLVADIEHDISKDLDTELDNLFLELVAYRDILKKENQSLSVWVSELVTGLHNVRAAGSLQEARALAQVALDKVCA